MTFPLSISSCRLSISKSRTISFKFGAFSLNCAIKLGKMICCA
ncbi:hypothetical protein V12B01_13300 [Vibrio splendidus 12B01]|nr:hypothetical protein V12B01_13300 [Vibrio splendidus 12B01]